MVAPLLDPRSIRVWRLELGLTQAELARMSGVSQAYIARIEKGNLDPKLSTLRRILEVLSQKRRQKMFLQDVMSAPVVSATPEERVEAAVKTMVHHGFSQLPVVRGGVPVGTLSERNVMHSMASLRDPGAVALSRVDEIMASAPPVLSPDTDISIALPLLDTYPMVLVMNGGRVTGIVTKADILRTLEAQRDKISGSNKR
jgi:predicted transcriptional regulator